MSAMARGLEWLLEVGLHGRRPGTTPAFAPERIRGILVVRKDNIGDILCTTPALRALRRAFPNAHLAILVSEHCRAVVEGNPDLDEVLTYTKAKHHPGATRLQALLALGRTIRGLRRRGFDLALAMGRPCSRSSAWLAYASGASWRLGYSTPALQPFPFFLNLGCDPGVITSHEVDGCLELLGRLEIPSAGRRLTLAPDPRMQAAIRRRLSDAGAPPGNGLALIHISSRREDNRWPLPAFARAADALRERLGLSPVLSWAPGDATNPLFPGDDGKADEVAARMATRPILLRTPTLAELIAAVSLSDFVLSPDGGFMHIAGALQIPQVALFGGSDPRQWGPVNPKSRVLRRDGRADRISVEEVVAAATEVLARWGRGRPAAGVAGPATQGGTA
jgi:ADP-heptose:LPS heptosyltransferase